MRQPTVHAALCSRRGEPTLDGFVRQAVRNGWEVVCSKCERATWGTRSGGEQSRRPEVRWVGFGFSSAAELHHSAAIVRGSQHTTPPHQRPIHTSCTLSDRPLVKRQRRRGARSHPLAPAAITRLARPNRAGGDCGGMPEQWVVAMLKPSLGWMGTCNPPTDDGIQATSGELTPLATVLDCTVSGTTAPREGL